MYETPPPVECVLQFRGNSHVTPKKIGRILEKQLVGPRTALAPKGFIRAVTIGPGRPGSLTRTPRCCCLLIGFSMRHVTKTTLELTHRSPIGDGEEGIGVKVWLTNSITDHTPAAKAVQHAQYMAQLDDWKKDAIRVITAWSSHPAIVVLITYTLYGQVLTAWSSLRLSISPIYFEIAVMELGKPKITKGAVLATASKLILAQEALDEAVEHSGTEGSSSAEDDEHLSKRERARRGRERDELRAARERAREHRREKRVKEAKRRKHARRVKYKAEAEGHAANLLTVKESVRGCLERLHKIDGSWHDPCSGEQLREDVDSAHLHADELDQEGRDSHEIRHLREYADETGGYFVNIEIPEEIRIPLPPENETHMNEIIKRGCCGGGVGLLFAELWPQEEQGRPFGAWF